MVIWEEAETLGLFFKGLQLRLLEFPSPGEEEDVASLALSVWKMSDVGRQQTVWTSLVVFTIMVGCVTMDSEGTMGGGA